MLRSQYIEDTSLAGRKREIDIKLARVREMLAQHDAEALALQMHPNFSWMTAGAKNFVANCFDAGATTLLITRDECFAFCNVIETPDCWKRSAWRNSVSRWKATRGRRTVWKTA